MSAPRPEYISSPGYTALEAELIELARVERPEVVNRVALAAAEGDRSENAEYIYGKKRLREIDKRMEFLSNRLDVLTPIPRAVTDERVVFLSWLSLEDAEGETHVFRIVGADETDAKAGWISLKSPVGRALLGHRVDDEVTVKTPGGLREYTINEISIEPFST
jgi:transcription elongation factor GreB